MNDERLVREMWKELPLRPVVGARLVRSVGARGWERPRFARFGRFFERCGVPDPWDPGAGNVEIGLGEVGVAQRKQVAPHAAPPAAPGAPKSPGFPNVPRAPSAPPPESRASADGKPAPRIGETRKDDTAILKKKLAEAERLKADPARANAYKVQQPVAKLPQRPDLVDGAVPSAASRPTARPGAARPAPGPRPSAGGAGRPFRMPIEPTRRLPDGPEEIPVAPTAAPPSSPTVEPPTTASAPASQRPAARFGDFGLGGGWDDDDLPLRPERPAPPPVSYAVDSEPPKPTPAPPSAAAPPAAPSAPRAAPSAPTPSVPIPSAPRTASTAPPPSAPRPASSAPTPSGPSPSAAPPRPTPSPSASAPRPPVEPPRPAATPPKPGAPPPRPQKPGGGGLDDLFGMGAAGGDNTRFRMPKREDADAAKPRRPMVTPDADLGKGGIDRRPPPPKPPSVAPTGTPSKPAPDFDGDGGD